MKFVLRLSFLSLLVPALCSGNIVRRSQLRSVLAEIKDKDTLIVFDLDQTLVDAFGQLTESGVLELLQDLKRRGLKVIALTGRQWKGQEYTRKQLKDLGIVFTDSSITNELFTFNTHAQMPHEAAGHVDGIIFCGWNPKGKMLMLHLFMTEHKPSKVVFIDDHLPFVQSVDEWCEKHQIPCACIHYC